MLFDGNNRSRIGDIIHAVLNPSEDADHPIDASENYPFLVSSTVWKNVSALVPLDHRLSTDARLERFILHHIRLDGARALRYLKRHPDQAFSAQVLWQALAGIYVEPHHPGRETSGTPQDINPGRSGLIGPDEFESGAHSPLLESSIPIADEHCLREINRELGRLMRQREAALALRMDTTPLDGEIQALRRYLRECSYPDGRPRSFPSVNRRAAQSMSLSLKRFRERVTALDPELAVYMESHLGTSPQFIWISEGGIERGKRE